MWDTRHPANWRMLCNYGVEVRCRLKASGKGAPHIKVAVIRFLLGIRQRRVQRQLHAGCSCYHTALMCFLLIELLWLTWSILQAISSQCWHAAQVGPSERKITGKMCLQQCRSDLPKYPMRASGADRPLQRSGKRQANNLELFIP